MLNTGGNQLFTLENSWDIHIGLGVWAEFFEALASPHIPPMQISAWHRIRKNKSFEGRKRNIFMTLRLTGTFPLFSMQNTHLSSFFILGPLSSHVYATGVQYMLFLRFELQFSGLQPQSLCCPHGECASQVVFFGRCKVKGITRY